MDQNKTLGEGSIPKLLFRFSMPCVAGLLISAFYNIVDQIFIGNSSLGYLGNAATGISFPVLCIANAFAWCVGDGAAAFLSICSGRNDSESAHKCVGTGLSATFLISLVLSAVCLAFRRPLMVLFGASDATVQLAVDYFTIIALFFPVYLLINVMNSMIRADGSPTYAMICMSIGAVLNIILDPLFIFVLDWGIKGAAWATVLGQMVSFVVAAAYFKKPRSFKLTRRSFLIDLPMLGNLVRMGGSTFITQIAIVTTTLLCNVSLFRYGALSHFGSDIPISVYSIQTKVYTIVNNLVVGIALGGQPILGYNYGAGRMDRVRKTYRLILTSCVTVGVLATLLFELRPQMLIRLFGTAEGDYLDFAVTAFRISLSLTVFTCIIKLSTIFFQAIGKAGQAIATALTRDILCFVPFTLILCSVLEANTPGTGVYGVLLAAPLADLVAGLLGLIMAFVFFKKLKTPEPAKSQPVLRPSHLGPIITIGREHGSQGKQIGRLVAQKLDIPFYYKEMTALAAKESGLSNEFISHLNRSAPAVFHELYLASTASRQAVIAQEKVIRRIAEEGSCVIVGRAADYVLRDKNDLVRVFVKAPKELRVQNIQKMYGDSEEDARANLVRADKARAAYYRTISGLEWSDAQNYDLVVDSSIGAEAAAQTIVDFLKQKGPVSG